MRLSGAGVTAGVVSVAVFVGAADAAPLPTEPTFEQAAGFDVSIFERADDGRFGEKIDRPWRAWHNWEYAESEAGDLVHVERTRRVNGPWMKYRAHQVATFTESMTNVVTLTKTKKAWSFKAVPPAPANKVAYGYVLFTAKASGQRMVSVMCIVDASNNRCAAKVARLYR